MGAPAGKPRRRENLGEKAIIAWNKQRTRTQAALTEKYELENRVRRGELLDRKELERVFSELADAICSIIENSGLSREDREQIRRNLAGIPLVLDGQARRQDKRPQAGASAAAKKRGSKKRENGEMAT